MVEQHLNLLYGEIVRGLGIEIISPHICHSNLINSKKIPETYENRFICLKLWNKKNLEKSGHILGISKSEKKGHFSTKTKKGGFYT